MSNCSNLATGITLGCDNNIGGLKCVWITESSNVTSLGLSSPGNEIGTINMSGKFYGFQFNKNNADYIEVGEYNQQAGRDLYKQTVTLILNRREKTKRDQLILLAQHKNLAIIAEDQNGLYWYFGETNGMNLLTNTGGSGKAKSDLNQYVLIFEGEEPNPANTVTQAAITANT